MKLLPLALSLKSRPVLIIGGGKVAARKLAALRETGALITVISPVVTFPTDGLQYHPREFLPGDEQGFALVFAATDNPEVNCQITELAQAAGAWVNNASDPDSSDFHTAATLRRGPLTIAITTNGESPVLASHARQIIETALGPEYETLLEIASKLEIPLEHRGEFWRRALAGDALDTIRAQNISEATQTLQAILQELQGKTSN